MPTKDGRHFTEGISKRIFWTENIHTLIEISEKYVPKGPVVNKSALVQVMAWCLIRYKSLLKATITTIHDAIWHHWITLS